MQVSKTNTSSRAPASVRADDAVSAPPAPADGAPTDHTAGPGAGNGLTRVTVNLNRQAVQALEAVSEATGYSKTDTINRALQIYSIIQGIMERNGGSLNIKHDNGETERVHIV